MLRFFSPGFHARVPARAGSRLPSFALAALVVGALCPALASAAPGDLDASFGSTLPDGTELNAIALRADGGTFAAGRTGEDELVAAFSPSGALQGSSPLGPGVLRGVALQSDGKVVVAGEAAGRIVVKRLGTNGALDPTFGTGGTVQGPVGGRANAVALGPNGTIVVGGSVPISDSFPRALLLRLKADGSPDTGFGSGGAAILNLGKDSVARGVVVQNDGKILFAGSQGPGDTQVVNALVARVDAAGTLDGTFASGGAFFYYHPFGGGASVFNAVALDPAGGVLVGGGDSVDSGPQALLVRLTCAGAADGTFGTGGVQRAVASNNFIGQPYGVNAIAPAVGHRVVGGGRFQDSGTAFATLWGREANGASAFATQAPASAENRGLVVDAAGNFVVAGTRIPAGLPTQGFVARYTGFGGRATGSAQCGGATPTPPPPPGQSAPGVTTGRATSVNAAGGRLAGTVDPNGAATTYYFEYGRTTAYGSRTRTREAGAGTAAVSVGAGVSKLRSRTRYHYRLVAVNAGGTTRGADASFSTPRKVSLVLAGLPRRPLSLPSVLRSGLTLRSVCNQACRIDARLELAARDARRLHLGKRAVSVGSAHARLRHRGTARARIVLTRAARRAFAKQRSVKLTLRLTAKAPAGGPAASLRRTVTFVR